MSVRAYRINKVELEVNPTLNCWHDSQLLDFLLDGDVWQTHNEDGTRQFEVDVRVLKQAIEAIEEGSFDSDYEEYKTPIIEVRKDIIKALKRDIAWAKKHKQDYVMYDCY